MCIDECCNCSVQRYLQETVLPRSKYEEDVFINNHTTVWGSWWKDHQWGYKCCKQMIWNSYCTGAAGIKAAEAATDLMKANIDRKEATKGLSQFCLLLLDLAWTQLSSWVIGRQFNLNINN